MTANLFADIPADLPEELTQTLAESGPVRIERIVSRGHASPPDFWYDQEQDEWAVLLQGFAELRLRDPDETIELDVGDHVLIPAHRRHRVEYTSDEPEAVWLAVHF